MAANDDDFDANGYLQSRYEDIRTIKTKGILDELHKVFLTSHERGKMLKVLDFGCGPVLQHCISVAAFASEIVFSDISPTNRDTVRKWLDGDADAFNWSPHFDYVVKTLEGKGEKEAREREQRVRQISKVVFCDALSERIVEKGYEGPYDIILQMSCLEGACTTKDSYKSRMKTLTTLLKPGGVMVNQASNGFNDYEGAHYPVGNKEHSCIRLTSEYVVSVFKECGFENVTTAIIPLDQSWFSEQIKDTANGLRFIYGTKK